MSQSSSLNWQRSRSPLVVTLIFLLILAGLGWWAYSTIQANSEQVTERRFINPNLNPSGAGWRRFDLLKDWFSAQDLRLRRPGNNAEMLAQLQPTDVVLALTGSSEMPSHEVEKLLAWVKNGGNLIVEAYSDSENSEQQTDQLLAPLGVQASIDSSLNGPETFSTSMPAAAKVEKAEVRASFGWDGFRLQAGQRKPQWSAGSDQGQHLLGYQFGDGWITVVSDGTPFTDARLAQKDHAALLRGLLQLHKQWPQQVWLLSSLEPDNLFAFLWRHAAATIVVLAILILLALARAGYRFGPRRNEPQPGRRALVEHIDASANLNWQHEGRDALVLAAREGLLEKIQQRHPGWERLDEKQRLRWLADKAGYRRSQVRDVLYGDEPLDARRFALTIRRLQKLRNCL